MDKLFGVPINNMMIGLLVALGIGAVIMVVASLRNPVLFKMGVRNITRRPAQTTLIVLGLMLTTLLFSSALSTGDTMNYSIKKSAMDMLGPVDEVVQARALAEQENHMGNQTGRAQANGQYFGRAEVDKISGALATSGLTDGFTPIVTDKFPAVSPESKQNLPELKILGVESDYTVQTAPLTTTSGQALAVGSLSGNDAYLSAKAAGKLDVREGNTVQIFSVSGPRRFNIAGVYESGGNSGETAPSMIVPIRTAQELTGMPDRYNLLLISNRGGMFEGVDSTDAVTAALEPAPAGTSLDIKPVKKQALDMAEQAASSFTSIFLLFGEFSMIAGILLIFLIFVMLAAERKIELGVMRAMGSKRRDLLLVLALEGIVSQRLAAAVGPILGAVLVRVRGRALG